MTLGNGSAAVALIVFTDYECPFCRRFARDTWPQLLTRYVDTGKVMVAQWHKPLEAIHPFALRAASAVTCAGSLGAKYWEMSDLLFTEPIGLDDETVLSRAAMLGFDKSLFRQCLVGPTAARVSEEGKAAERLGVASTPTFFIGLRTSANSVKVTQRISGAQPFKRFATELEKALAGR